jgi:hypothetical protein
MKKIVIVLGLCAAATLQAQGPPPGRGPGRMGPGDRGMMMGMGRGGELGRPVTGAPYSALEVTQTTQTLSNGNVISRTTQSTVYRDSQGRVRTETTLPARPAAPGQTAEQTPRTIISIRDPVAKMSRELDPQNKTAREMPMPGFGGAGAGFAGRGARQDAATRPNGRGATTDPNLLRESLPEQAINGVMASGARETRTIPAGQIGNAQTIQTVRETWMSTDLKVPVMIRISDPRIGTTTTQLTNVVRSEPDASLFQTPADYKVVRGARGGMMGPRGGPAPASNQ